MLGLAIASSLVIMRSTSEVRFRNWGFVGWGFQWNLTNLDRGLLNNSTRWCGGGGYGPKKRDSCDH
jgi:hypothetical protein